MDKKRYKVYAPVSYVMGYLKYGHYEGEVELTDNEVQQLKDKTLSLKDICEDNLQLIVDEYDVEDCGEIYKVQLEEISNEV